MPQVNFPFSYREGGRYYAYARSSWVFSHLSVLHDKDPVRIHDSIQPVSDGEHRAPGKLLAYRLLLSTKTGVMRSEGWGGGAKQRAKRGVGEREKSVKYCWPWLIRTLCVVERYNNQARVGTVRERSSTLGGCLPSPPPLVPLAGFTNEGRIARVNSTSISHKGRSDPPTRSSLVYRKYRFSGSY